MQGHNTVQKYHICLILFIFIQCRLYAHFKPVSIVKKHFRDPDNGGKMYISPLIVVGPTDCVPE